MRTSMSFAGRLGRKLIGLISMLFIVVVGLLIVSGYYSTYQLTVKNCATVLDNGVINMNWFIESVESSVKDAEWLVPDNCSDSAQLSSIAEKVVKSNDDILSCTIVFSPDARVAHAASVQSFIDESGKVSTRVINADSLNLRECEWFTVPESTKRVYWTDPERAGDRLLASFSKPLYHDNGKFIGVIRCVVDIHGSLAQMEEKNPYPKAYTAIVSQNDSLFTADPDLSADGRAVQVIVDIVDGGKSEIRHLWKGSLQGIVLYAPISNGWSNVFVFPYSIFLYFYRVLNAIFIVLILLGIGLLYFICMKTVTRMSQPITEFAYAARSIGQGNFKTKIPEVSTQDEFRRFYDSLHYMEDSINDYIDELKKTTAANERFESELNIANEIQMQMLPHEFPELDEVDLYAALKPAKEVGGDLYDFFVRGRKLYFIVGDVSGKGVPASLLMAITKAAFHTVSTLDITIREIADKINYAFCTSNDSGMFVTLFLGYIDLDTLQMEYCNCGHNQIIIDRREEGDTEYLDAITNIAGGCFEDFEFQSETMQLHRGMRLLLYTDGVTEAENKAKDLYGDDRLLEFATSLPAETPSSQYVAELERSLEDFIGTAPQSDDITIMSILLK